MDHEDTSGTQSEELGLLSVQSSLPGEEEGSDDLFGDVFEKDYMENPELDRYETEDEDEEVLPLTSRQLGRANREVENILGHSNEEEEESSSRTVGIGDFDSLQHTLGTQKTQAAVRKEILHFLKTHDRGHYMKMIRHMAAMNNQSLYVDYFHLEAHSAPVALAAVSLPSRVFPILNEALKIAVASIFPHYSKIQQFIFFRLTGTPSLELIRELRNVHLNSLVKVLGIITKRSRVYPLLSLVKYDCRKCRAILGPFLVENEAQKPNHCIECQSSGPFSVNTTDTVYKDFQKLTIQEAPGTVPSGRLPRSKEVVVLHDLIDAAKPGDEVELIGVYKNNYSNTSAIRAKAPVFFTTIEAISIQKRGEDSALHRTTPEEEKEIRRISRRPNVLSLIISSLAPSIHGHYDAKRAIALSLFSGVPKQSNDNYKIRGDINVLLLGDPGMAKSQLLKYTEGISHRAVFATGQGASAVGLTAMVHKDPATKEWTLEGGALVLADKGVCLIDEFDKMKDTDRVSIHEAMEQQSISISKAGIVTSLQARCAVIAAANPNRGRYNPALTFSQNVNLSDPIISRFDVICVIKDEFNPEQDRKLAEFVTDSHMDAQASAHSSEVSDHILPQSLLRKYICYARKNVKPRIESLDVEKISSLYASLRKESAIAGSIPITVRHVESVIRIAEAFAKMHLREVVTRVDIDMALSVVLDSFCGTQKTAIKKALQRKFRKYLVLPEDDAQSAVSFLATTLSASGGTRSVPTSDLKPRLPSGLPLSVFFNSKAFTESCFSLSRCGKHVVVK